ncbi:MAG TPA: hypothetical protein PLX24_09555 [Bacteroidales bacterium]|nr:hypothetical protein [Bacteroidales bacterium]HPV35561.1 hypothetical protein [Bacteroidales bacterium]HRC66532.1 hypothetical protein [Bacteroidales bacterium]
MWLKSQINDNYFKKAYLSSISEMRQKTLENPRGFCGLDGTRTRDLRRDRAAF